MIRPGNKSLVEAIGLLTALHHQLINTDNDQQIERFGVMVVRWATEPGSSEADVRELEKKVYGRHFAQDVRIVDAIKVLRELVGEHEMSSVSVPASELGPKEKNGG